METILINPHGLTAKAKNPYSNSSRTDKLFYDDFEANNPSYDLTEPGEPGKECLGSLDWYHEYFNNGGGVSWTVDEHDAEKEKICDDNDLKHQFKWQVASNKEEAPLNMKYRKKPVEIEAIQYSETNLDEVLQWCEGNATYEPMESGINLLVIQTLESNSEAKTRHAATIGDFIIKGVKGEFYPCKPDIFKLTYDISPQAVTEQSIESLTADELRTKYWNLAKDCESDYSIFQMGVRCGEEIAGANHILSSKGLVEREAVDKLIEDRIAILHDFSLRDNIQYETADKMRFAKGELTDLITKFRSL